MGRNNIVGAWGEALAADYLQRKLFRIITTAYRCRFGEIDLIVSDRKYLIFVEVKLRRSADFARACEYVDFHACEGVGFVGRVIDNLWYWCDVGSIFVADIVL